MLSTTIAVIWGWLPAILWVVFGSIFLGAVHDLGALVVSLRNKGRTIGDIAGDLLGPRVRYIFLGVLIMGLWIVLAVFGLVIAAVLKQFPGAIAPFLFQIPLAVVIGVVVHRRGKSILGPSVAALVLMYASVVWGDFGPLHSFNEFLASQPTWVWTLGLLAYAYVASVLPVWVLLQPRDYINALQLLTALALLVTGIAVAGIFGGLTTPIGDAAAQRVPLEIVAPVVDWNPTGAPPLIPILFITIACGAISGFHCLVGSGTTSKQLSCETHAKQVGYGSMLTEGFLAALVIVACAAGLGLGTRVDGQHAPLAGSAWRSISDGGLMLPADQYSRIMLKYDLIGHGLGADSMLIVTEINSNGMTEVVDAIPNPQRVALICTAWWELSIFFPQGEAWATGASAYRLRYAGFMSYNSTFTEIVTIVCDGAANLIASLRIPREMAVALIGVLVASFAGTTMDTACRLQCYVVQELARGLLPRVKGPACGRCGYDLRGVSRAEGDAVRCPECGESERLIEEGRSERLARVASAWNPMRWLATTHGATLFAVVTAGALAAMPAPWQSWSLASVGGGGLILWPLLIASFQVAMGLLLLKTRLIVDRSWRQVYRSICGAVMIGLSLIGLAWFAFVDSADYPSLLNQRQWVPCVAAVILMSLTLSAVSLMIFRPSQPRRP